MKNILKLIPSALLALSVNAQAAVTITMYEVGNDVVITGSGSITTFNGLTYNSDFLQIQTPIINPQLGLLTFNRGEIDAYEVQNAPESFGTGGPRPIEFPDTSSGTAFGPASAENPTIPKLILLPKDYQVNEPINVQATIKNQKLSDLGIDAGTYIWSWGTQADGDSVTLCIEDPAVCPKPPTAAPTPVPTLGAFGLMGLAGVIGAAGVAMNRRRKK